MTSLQRLLASCVTLALAGCTGIPSTPTQYGVEAGLRPLRSGVTGKITAIDKGDGVSVLVSIANMAQGNYRIALHETGNCSSPNGFAAGPLYPPGSDPRRSAPILQANPESSTTSTVHVSGVKTADLMGRSVLVYDGTRLPEVQPGVPNNVIACGVFSAVVPLDF